MTQTGLGLAANPRRRPQPVAVMSAAVATNPGAVWLKLSTFKSKGGAHLAFFPGRWQAWLRSARRGRSVSATGREWPRERVDQLAIMKSPLVSVRYVARVAQWAAAPWALSSLS